MQSSKHCKHVLAAAQPGGDWLPPPGLFSGHYVMLTWPNGSPSVANGSYRCRARARACRRSRHDSQATLLHEVATILGDLQGACWRGFKFRFAHLTAGFKPKPSSEVCKMWEELGGRFQPEMQAQLKLYKEVMNKS